MLKQNSAKECAICHYSWIDTFYVNNRSTCLAELPEKPVAAVSQMCFSCHDGSTVDSRKHVFNDMKHQVGITPSDKLEIPEIFPLDDDGKMDCATCHSAHGVSSELGIEKTIFLRTSNENSEMCRMCHVDKIGGPEKGNHPIDVSSLKIPAVISRYGGYAGNKSNQVICESCHVAHGGFTDKRLVLPIDRPGIYPVLCETCHTKRPVLFPEDSFEAGPTHPVDVHAGATTQIPDQWESGSRVVLGKGEVLVCSTCHTPHNAVQKKALLVAYNYQDSLCTECHNDQKSATGSSHDIINSAAFKEELSGLYTSETGTCSPCHLVHKGFGTVMNALKLKNPGIKPGDFCTSCHRAGGAAENVMAQDFSHPMDITLPATTQLALLPLFDEKGIHANGKIRCSTCHAFHNPFPFYDDPEKQGVKRATYLRLSKEGPSNICILCHPQHGFIEGTDHDLRMTAADYKNSSGQTPAQGGVCSPCHVAHKAIQQKHLWAAPIGPVLLEGWEEENKIDNDMMTMLCTGCHSSDNNAEKQIPKFGLHPKGFFVPKEETISGKPVITFEMVKEKFPIFTDTGEIAENGSIVCSTCHNPHQWNPNVEEVGPGKNIEGNATNSFLRPELHSEFCNECHGKDGLIKFKFFHSHISRQKKTKSFLFK